LLWLAVLPLRRIFLSVIGLTMTPLHTESVVVMPQNVQYDNFEKNLNKSYFSYNFHFYF